MPKISVVIPMMNEAEAVDEMISRLAAMANSTGYDFEFIVVDDGSTDGTFSKLYDWREREPRLTIVKLSRNWGHQNAYNAGLDLVEEADAIVLMDGDLEDPPELIPRLISAWEHGHEVVYTVKERRHQTPFRRALTSLYYMLVRHMSDIELKTQAGMFSLIDRKVLEQLRRFGESNKSYPSLRSFVGFRQTEVAYAREPRRYGEPKQSLYKLMRDGFNAILAFSYVPIRLMTLFGLVTAAFFMTAFVLVLGVRIFDLDFWIFRLVPGWTSIIMLLLFVSSIQIVFLGLLGEYIARIFDEVKGRPYYIVESVYAAGSRRDSGAEVTSGSRNDGRSGV